jgi:hypothetical protein
MVMTESFIAISCISTFPAAEVDTNQAIRRGAFVHDRSEIVAAKTGLLGGLGNGAARRPFANRLTLPHPGAAIAAMSQPRWNRLASN